jgi:CheY-like chemotaxis protein
MRRVLIVDDEHLVADTLSLIFEKHGFTTRAVYSADEALDCARSFAPDLLLCDIHMPDKDGLELIDTMDREQPSCRILVLTGAYASLNRVRQHASEASHAFSVLTKPCNPAELLRCAGELLLPA